MTKKISFVYRWIDLKSNKVYIGMHTGHIDDGYISSSNILNEQYKLRPEDFKREILFTGTTSDVAIKEAALLNEVDARNNSQYYNQHNGDGNFRLKAHTKDSKGKISRSKQGKLNPNKGKVFSEETREKMRQNALRRWRDPADKIRIRQKGASSLPPRTDKHKEKIRMALLGRKRTKEVREAISRGHTGKKLSASHRDAISKGMQLRKLRTA